MATATGATTAIYRVTFTVGTDSGLPRLLNVSLIDGYSEFESIRMIIAARAGVNATDITVLSLTLAPSGRTVGTV